MKRYLVLLLACCVWLAPYANSQVTLITAQSPAKILADLPVQTQWKTLGGTEILDSSQLAKTKPKEGAIFNEYGFARTFMQKLERGGLTASLEIYEMSDPPAAYGVFTFYRPAESKLLTGMGTLGAESREQVSFTQNIYYVRVSINNGTEQDSGAARELAQLISTSLPKGAYLPPLIGKLPKENHIAQSTLYVLGPVALNEKLPLGGKDLFGLSNSAEAVKAEYRSGAESATLLLMLYPTPQLAKKFLELGYPEYAAAHPGQSILFKREGPLVELVLSDKASSALSARLLERLSFVSDVSWDPKVKPLDVARLMINIFLFLGVLLLFALAAGLLFALFRIAARRFWPGKIIDRPEQALIALHLQWPKGAEGSPPKES